MYRINSQLAEAMGLFSETSTVSRSQLLEHSIVTYRTVPDYIYLRLTRIRLYLASFSNKHTQCQRLL